MDKEFDVLRVVKDHPNVAKVYALQKRKAYGGWEARVLMEYCPVGLFDYLKLLEKEKRFIAEEDIWGMMYDLVSAVGFMHKQNPPMVHRDLKLENVMQGKDGRWKLIDFGSVVYGITGGLGFLLAIYLFSTVRERLEFADYPKAFEGFPIALITAGLIALAFMGFSGLQVWPM